MRTIDNQFYQSPQWKKTKKQYKKLVDGLCERCLAKGFLVPARVVHHKKHLNESNYTNPEIAYGFDNLEALCQDCHNKEHFGEKKEKRFVFVDGKLIIPDE